MTNMEVPSVIDSSHPYHQQQKYFNTDPIPSSPTSTTTIKYNSNTPSLLCDETIDMTELNKTPPNQFNGFELPQELPEVANARAGYPDCMPPTVKALHDQTQLNDARVLQNLLRNEHRFTPEVKDYMSMVQSDITPEMRKLVADWMLGVVHEQNSQPEVFCLAINLLDRFLCHCCIRKSQLQLLGSVCILIGSKIREPCPIPGKTLITYTDYSITAEELKVSNRLTYNCSRELYHNTSVFLYLITKIQFNASII